jgi:non-heme chloroperoxidase
VSIATILGAAGLELAASAWGDPANPPVLLVHGGGQSRHTWTRMARGLAEAGAYAVAYDQRGHGQSSWPADGDYSDDALVADLCAVARTFPRPPALVGASIGGLAALRALYECPGVRASCLVLIDIAHRADPAASERIRQFMEANVEGFATVEMVGEAVVTFLGRERPTDLARLERNLRRGDDGRWHWHWDPRFVTSRPASEEQLAEREERFRTAARALTIPTLLIRAGRESLVSEEDARDFLAMVPHARYLNLVDADHPVSAETAHVFTEAVSSFLAEVLELSRKRSRAESG